MRSADFIRRAFSALSLRSPIGCRTVPRRSVRHLASRRARLVSGLVAAGVSGVLTACRCDEGPPPAPAEPTPAPQGAVEPQPAPERYDIIDHIDDCALFHEGLVLDLGSPSMRARENYALASPPVEPEVIDREGARFLRMTKRRQKYDFWLEQRQTGVRVRSRLHGGSARTLTFYVDGHRIGTARLQAGETQTVRTVDSDLELTPGRHTLALHFSGAGRGGDRHPFAEIDWINVGNPAKGMTETYDAPTAHKVVVDVDIDGRLRRSIVLGAASTLRCPIVPSPDAMLRLSVGFWGLGSGKGKISFSTDNDPTVSEQVRRVRGGSGATWAPVELNLKPHAGHLGMLEFRAIQSSAPGRVVFGDPVIVRREAHAETAPRARVVVIVVNAGLDRRRIPPWGPVGKLTALGELTRASAGFSGYRTPTTVPAGAAASLLTGSPPHVHKLDDGAARLAPSVKLLSGLLKQAGGRAAMFTGVPSTFPAFGFDVGWDRYEQFSPVKDIAATEPLDRAIAWLRPQLHNRQSSPILVVVHTRGAHPPWDLNRDEVRRLPPEEYGGPLDARRGGIELARIRGEEALRRRRLTEQDWTRLHALMDAAMAKQSKALGRLLEIIERADAWNDTMVVFMGDVAVGNAPALPFDPVGQLREDQLLTPLLVRFPGGTHGGKTVSSSVTTTDVTFTVLRALGLAVPEWTEGDDLFRVAAGVEPLAGRPYVATLEDTYATRLGNWLLRGRLGKVPSLCQTDVDPSCLTDAFAEPHHAGFVLWYQTVLSLGRGMPGVSAAQREPASLDPDTVAALTVWGDIP